MENWEIYFTDTILKRGQEYYKDKHVDNLKISDTIIKADVYGNDLYKVKIMCTDNNINSVTCNCPYPGNCKHIAAVLYALKETKKN